MATTSPPPESVIPATGNWSAQEPQTSRAPENEGAIKDLPESNGAPMNGSPRAADDQEHAQYMDTGGDSRNGDSKPLHREKKPNKVYVGGLPEHTRQEDLQSCFGKIGVITAIELKLGYGFVEFETKEAAEESVAKYHEGYFMGNKIKVEISHGGGRNQRHPGEPGACFKCGQQGHWARECPNSNPRPRNGESYSDRSHHHTPRDYRHEDIGRPPPSGRDARYGYDYPPVGREPREYRSRPLSPPPRDRDYPPPPVRAPRDYDDRARGPPPPPPPRYDGRGGYYDVDGPRDPPGYGRAPYGPPRDYDRRSGHPQDRYSGYAAPMSSRPRSPPGPPPRARDAREDYDRLPRDYPPPEYRGRPISPPPARYADSGRSYRRRSQSPPPRSGGPGYPDVTAPYNGSSSAYNSSSGPRSGRDDYRLSDRSVRG